MLHLVGASDLEEDERRAREWAWSVWSSWSEQHGEIRRRLDGLLNR